MDSPFHCTPHHPHLYQPVNRDNPLMDDELFHLYSSDPCACDEPEEKKSALPCPGCGEAGRPVKRITVKHLVLPELEEQVGEGDWSICMKADCLVAYYGAGMSFDTRDVKVPIWFKEGAEPRIICYCNGITEEEIRRVVRERGLKDQQRVYGSLRGKVLSKCLVKNPLGECCIDAFREVVEAAAASSGH